MKNNQNHLSAESFWTEFIQLNPNLINTNIPESFYFCDNEKDANECADLVVKGIKRATSTSLWWFEKNKHKLPEKGDFHIITDWYGNAVAIIKNISVELVPFNKINSEYAKIEGEGDKSLNYWQKSHINYYNREMKPFNESFDKNMIIVCEIFETVYVKE